MITSQKSDTTCDLDLHVKDQDHSANVTIHSKTNRMLASISADIDPFMKNSKFVNLYFVNKDKICKFLRFYQKNILFGPISVNLNIVLHSSIRFHTYFVPFGKILIF